MAAGENAVRVLNDLISITLDSANGYKEAADNTESPTFKSVFAARAQRRRALCGRLQSEVRSLGGEPEDDQSVLGKMHNKFVDLKAALAGHDDKAVIDEVERGEDHIRDKFTKAAVHSDLPPHAQQLIEAALKEIQADHDEVAQVKRQLH